MKRLIATAALLLVVPMLASAQTADQTHGQGYVFFGLGTSVGGRSYQVPAVKQVGLGGERFLYEGLGLGADVGYARWGGGYESEALIASGDVSYHFRRHAARGGVDPFLLIGVTGFFPTSTGRGSPACNFGGGVNLWVTEHAALRLEARDHVYGSYIPGNQYLSFRVGVTFR